MSQVRSKLLGPRRRAGGTTGRRSVGTTRLGGRLSLRPWSGLDQVAHLVVHDHDVVPSRHDLAVAVAQARHEGYRRIRSSALFPAPARAFREAGFDVVDTLALLRLDLHGDRPHGADAPAVPTGARVVPLRPWHHDTAADVDRAAFGPAWGNDAGGIDEVRRATPVHHARRVDLAGEMAGFAISGAASRAGYLQRLAVRPEHRRRGAAAALVHDALRWMRRRGLTTVMVNTGVENTAALELYRRFGFELQPERLQVVEIDVDTAIDTAADIAADTAADPTER